MKRINIEIIVIAVLFVCTILLYVVQSNKNVANARDGIQGVVQPSPFITTPNEIEANLLQNANGSLIGQLIYLQREYLPEAEQKLLANNKDATQ